MLSTRRLKLTVVLAVVLAGTAGCTVLRFRYELSNFRNRSLLRYGFYGFPLGNRKT